MWGSTGRDEGFGRLMTWEGGAEETKRGGSTEGVADSYVMFLFQHPSK